MADKIRTGVVFSGGMAKGAYEIGFSKAFLCHSAFELSALSTASIGTLNGYAMAYGALKKAEELWKTVDLSGYKKIYDALFREQVIYDFIDDIVAESAEVILYPFYTVCCTSHSVKPIYIRLDTQADSMKAKYLKASISIPALTSGVMIGNERYFDGACLDNTPLSPLFQQELDLIICVQFDGYIPRCRLGSAGCPILFLDLQMERGLNDSFRLDRTSVERMIQYGFNTSDDVLTLLESRFPNRQRFIELIDHYNSKLKAKQLSADSMVRKINRLSKIIR